MGDPQNYLINAQTKQKEFLPDDGVENAVLSGSHQYQAGSRVEVRNPDGQLVTIPAEMLQSALQDGYSHYGARQKAIDDYVAENDNLKGSMKAALGSFGNQTFLGLPEIYNDIKGDPFERAKTRALEADHELSTIAGGVPGFGLSMLVGGPLFKAGVKAGQLTTRAVEATAAHILEAGGIDVTKRAALNASKSIVAKMAGGAAEGAVVTSPHALTEAALGDPETAAETLLWGGGIGAMFGGAGGAATELMGLSKKAAKSGIEFLGAKSPTAEDAKTKILEYFSGIKGDTIDAYKANKDRVLRMEGIDHADLTDNIARDVGVHAAREDGLFQNFKNTKEAAKQDFERAKAVLKSDAPDLQMSHEITESITKAKGRQQELNLAADTALEDATLKIGRTEKPVTWSRSQVLSDITSEIKRIVPEGSKGAISPEQIATIKELGGFYDRIKNGYEKEIKGTEMRDLMQTLRKSNPGGYGQSAGQYGDYYENAMRSIAEKASDRIKNKLGKYGYHDYEKIMNEMSTIARSMKEMDARFGTVDKSFSTLRGYTGARNPLIEKTLADFDKLHGTEFVPKLQKYKDNRALLEEGKIDPDMLKQVLIPNQHAEQQLAEQAWKEEAAKNDGFRHVTNKLVNTQRKLSMQDERALAALSQREGHVIGNTDYVTQINDKKILDEFDKAHIQGSRRVNAAGAAIGGALGSAFGPVGFGIGTALGATAGYVMDVDGGKLVRKLLDGETFLGPLFLEKQMRTGAGKLDRIPEVLKKMHARATTGGKIMASPVDTARMSAIHSMVQHIVEPEKKHDKQEVHSKINEQLSDWVSNPQLLIDRVGDVTGQVGRNGAPVIQGIAATKLIHAVEYLHMAMPKPARPKSPFAPEIKWRPSSFQIKGFEEKFEAIIDPFSVIDHLGNGTLTRNHMEAIKTIYPALHGHLQKRVYNSVLNGDVKLHYTDRMKLSLILNVPMDESMININRHQQSIQMPIAQPQGQPQQGGGGFKANINLSKQMQPESQQRGS